MTEKMNFSLISSNKSAKFLSITNKKSEPIILNDKFILRKAKIIGIDICDQIKVYDKNSLSLINSVKKNNILFFNFHNHFDSIFFVCDCKNVFIYQINVKDKKIIELSNIKEHFTHVIYADFSPFDPYILLSISQKYEIKIYDVRKGLPVSHIFIDEILDEENNLKIKWKQNEMGIISEKKIIFFDYFKFIKENIKIIKFQEDITDFHFYENQKDLSPIIVLTEKDIKYVLSQEYIKTVKTLDNKLYDSYFSQKYKILLNALQNDIIGLKFNFSCVAEVFKINIKQSNIHYPIYIYDENKFKENELCKFYYTEYDIIYFFSIVEDSNFEKEKDIDDIPSKNEQKEDFIKSIINNISDISMLLSLNNNNISSDYISNKKYFNYEEVKKELGIIKKRNLFKRKEIVNNNLKEISLKNNIIDKYNFLLSLLINDNTNTKLLNEYLLFLGKNKEQLKQYFTNIEEYETELNYYINIINVEDALNLFKKNKKSQKEELINIFDNILRHDSNNIDKFELFLNNYEDSYKDTIYYNMFTELDNEELCYYRYVNLIKKVLNNLFCKLKKQQNKNQNENDVNLESKEDEINLVDELNLLKYKVEKTKNYINKYKEKKENIEYLMILTVESSKKDEYNFGYNLVTSAKMSDDEIIEFKKNMENKVKSRIKDYGSLCKKNIEDFYDNDNYSKKIYDYQYYMNRHQEKYYFELVKKFYKNILPKKCFKSIYSTLYGEDEYYPFEDQNYTNDFVEKFFNFIPMKNSHLNGMTDKFSMKIFILTFLPKVIGGDNCSKLEKKILKEGLIINIGNHEIGHNFFSTHFYMENARIEIETPRKKSLDIAEGGYYIEYALYGRILETLNFQQALYIMNEDNYDKSYLEFQEGFNNIKKEDLIVKGAFEEIFKDFKIEDIDLSKYKNMYIPSNQVKAKEKYIVCKLKNDVLGRNISDKIYDEVYKKYT